MNRLAYLIRNTVQLGRARSLSASILLLTVVAEAHAADKFWNSTSGGTFSTSSNWQSCGFFCNPVAGPNDIAHFGISSPPSQFQFVYTVNFTTNPLTDHINQALRVEDDLVTFDLNGRTYSLTMSSGTEIGNVPGRVGQLTITDGIVDVAGVVLIGVGGGLGTLNIFSGGRLQTDFFAVIGHTGNSTVNVDGANSDWVHAGGLTVGGLGAGTLNVTAGGEVQSSTGLIGRDASNGIATISGANSRWINSSTLTIGNNGNGTLNITAGGYVQSTSGHVAFVAGHTGNVTVDAARWFNSGDLFLGDLGSGTMNITGGGLVQNVGAAIGAAVGSSGAVNVSSSSIFSSNWLNSGELNIGHSGSGTLNILTGGAVFNTNAFIGRFAGSVGAVNVNGPDATWRNTGNLTVGNDGEGDLHITDHAVVQSVDGTIGAGAASTGSVTIIGPFAFWFNSGILRVADSGHGTLNIEAGGNISSAGGRIGQGTGSSGAVVVDGPASAWTNSADLQVGNLGEASLTVTNGGTVSNTFVEIGGVVGIISSVTIDGAGSTWNNSGSLDVGDSGDAMLLVSNGGVVTNSTFGAIADASESDGVATITGAGSMWTIDSGTLYVGEDGTGTLHILAGGAVSNADSFIAFDMGSTGTALVSGAGSTWTNNGALAVGAEGEGELTIADAGSVSSGSGHIGEQAGSSGVAMVSGVGSTWTNTANLRVGHFGAGSLTIVAGGNVSNLHGVVGDFAGSSGTVVVSGAGSTWTNNGTSFIVAHSATGTLAIEDGGAVANVNGYIGLEAGSIGLVTVTGAGSQWQNTGALFVGGEPLEPGGQGTLRIQTGGTVTVAQNTDLFADGHIHLEGGTLDSQSISFQGGGEFDWTSGTLHVETFNGNLTNQGGTLAPGHSAGSTTINGSYAQQAGATLEIEIGGTSPGTEYDKITAAGTVGLGGTLDVDLLGGFVPAPGNSFQIITATGGISGTFSNVLLPTLSNSSWHLTYNPTSVLLQVGLLGDYNFNGVVDAADYIVWRKTLGQFGFALAADGNGNNEVDPGDYDVWRAHFGQTAGSGAGTLSLPAAPEPSAVTLLFLAAGVIITAARRHGRT